MLSVPLFVAEDCEAHFPQLEQQCMGYCGYFQATQAKGNAMVAEAIGLCQLWEAVCGLKPQCAD